MNIPTLLKSKIK